MLEELDTVKNDISQLQKFSCKLLDYSDNAFSYDQLTKDVWMGIKFMTFNNYQRNVSRFASLFNERQHRECYLDAFREVEKEMQRVNPQFSGFSDVSYGKSYLPSSLSLLIQEKYYSARIWLNDYKQTRRSLNS